MKPNSQRIKLHRRSRMCKKLRTMGNNYFEKKSKRENFE